MISSYFIKGAETAWLTSWLKLIESIFWLLKLGLEFWSTLCVKIQTLASGSPFHNCFTLHPPSSFPDINECDMVNDCHQECINTNGSFTCECLEGFVLDSNNRTCSGMQISPCDYVDAWLTTYSCGWFICSTVAPGNECPQNNSCSQNCLRINGTQIEQCSCRRGYQLSSDNTTCDGTDIVIHSECVLVALAIVMVITMSDCFYEPLPPLLNRCEWMFAGTSLPAVM